MNSHDIRKPEGGNTSESRHPQGITRRAVMAGGSAITAAALGGLWPRLAWAAKEPIRIGALGPLTDFTGRDILNAARLAVDEINAAGGIDGHPIELSSADSEKSPEKAIQAFQQLAARNRVHAIVGGFRSGSVLALLPYVGRFRKPFIITGAASPDITVPVRDSYDTHKYLFRAWVNAERQALSLAFVCRDILKKNAGFQRYAILAENYKWARDYADVLKPKLNEYGLDVVYESFHDPAIKDFTPIFRAAEQNRAQAALEIISNEAGYIVVKQWRDQKAPFALAGNNNPSYLVGSFHKDTEGACEYELSAYTKAPLSEKSLPFWEKFQKTYGDTPFYTGTGAYDAVYLLKQAVEAAGSLDADQIFAALEKVDYRGVIGRIRFDDRHEAITGPDDVPVSYGQWQNGDKVAIWPEKFSLGSYKAPPWL
jgi:branched-chain amino acid transport system substrate-binding protein